MLRSLLNLSQHRGPYYKVASGYKGGWEKNSHNSAAIVWLDAVVGEWLGWLRSRKLLDRTVVVFTSDHGMMGKRTCNEHGSRVPLIIRGPSSLLRPGMQVHSLVGLHDLPATFLHLVQSKPGKTKSGPAITSILEGDGTSIWPTLGARGTTEVHDALFCEIGYDRAVVGPGFKLVMRDADPDRPVSTGVTSHRSTHQLYNLTSDPNEQKNLLTAGVGATSGARVVHERLRKILDAHISSTACIVRTFGGERSIRPIVPTEVGAEKPANAVIPDEVTAVNTRPKKDPKAEWLSLE